MTDKVWSGVQVNYQSAAATAIAIDGISLASPGVLSHSGADPTDGDLVLVLCEGMDYVNSRVFRVDNQASGTFELEGEDTTDYAAFVSGTFSVLTMGNSLSTITSISQSGGEPEPVDNSTIHQLLATSLLSGFSQVEFGLVNKHRPDIAGLTGLKPLSLNGDLRAFQFVFANSSRTMFYASIGAVNVPSGGSRGDLVVSNATLYAQGLPTDYAT